MALNGVLTYGRFASGKEEQNIEFNQATRLNLFLNVNAYKVMFYPYANLPVSLLQLCKRVKRKWTKMKST